jgi:hypothetical protein
VLLLTNLRSLTKTEFRKKIQTKNPMDSTKSGWSEVSYEDTKGTRGYQIPEIASYLRKKTVTKANGP